MNVSADSPAVQRAPAVVSCLIFFVLALDRFINAVIAGSEVGTRTAWMLGSAFALTGTVLLGLLLFIGGASRPAGTDADTRSSQGRRTR